MLAVLIAVAASILIPLLIVALVERHLDRCTKRDGLGQLADPHDSPFGDVVVVHEEARRFHVEGE
jgi:hypothetical protein